MSYKVSLNSWIENRFFKIHVDEILYTTQVKTARIIKMSLYAEAVLKSGS
jgi:hypothetical protein